MRIKTVFMNLSALGTMLSLNMSELLGDTSAVEEGGFLHGPFELVKSTGGGIVMLGGAILIVLAIVCVFIYTGGILVDHGNAMKMQEKKRSFLWIVFAIVLAAAGAGLVVWCFTNGKVFSNKMIEESGTAFLNTVLPILRA